MTYDGPKISREEAREQGLKRFFTGEPCKEGHIAQRFVSSGTCCECVNQKRREKRRSNGFSPKERPANLHGPFIERAKAKELGLRYYFNGYPCSKGHVTLRTVAGACTGCMADYNKSEAAKEYKRKHYQADKAANPERYVGPEAAKKQRERRKANPGMAAGYSRTFRDKNLEAVRKDSRDRNRRRYQEDSLYRMINNLRRRYAKKIQRNAASSTHVHQELLSCTVAECRAHLESQFQPGMSWENMANEGWHIDHIRPCASFDLNDPEQQKVCFNWRNLAPMWAKDNLQKNDEYEPHHEVEWSERMRELGYDGELFLVFEEGRGGLYGQEGVGEVDT